MLIIDEANTISRGDNRSHFGREAIDELVAQMENRRDRLIVVVAGYPEEMHQFVDANPGLKSRFTQYIDFPDYTADELGEILNVMAARESFALPDEVRLAAQRHLSTIQRRQPHGFGNGRAVRNLYEAMKDRFAERVIGQEGSTAPQALVFDLTDVPPTEI